MSTADFDEKAHILLEFAFRPTTKPVTASTLHLMLFIGRAFVS